MISAIGHVALQVSDVDACVRHATSLLGLREVERTSDAVFLTEGRPHHSLEYRKGERTALDHIGLEVATSAELETLAGRLASERVTVISERVTEPGLVAALRFVGPGGHVYEVYSAAREMQPKYVPRGVRPRRFGHITVTTGDTKELRSFWERVLGFRLSDDVGNGILTFMRCNADHHGLAMAKGPEGIHHFAFEVANIAELARLGDLLDEQGQSFIWGPGRHGAGENIFTYHYDPAGTIVEYYTDMLRIYNEASYRPGSWDISDRRFANMWGAGVPDGFIEHVQPLAEAHPARA